MEVAFSQQLFLLSLKKNYIFFEVYLATGNREVGAQNLDLQFARVFFSHGCAGHMPKINYFSVGLPQLVYLLDPIYAGWTRLVHVVCTLCTLSLVAALTKLLHTPPFSHCTWVVKCSAWCMLSLNRRTASLVLGWVSAWKELGCWCEITCAYTTLSFIILSD